MESVKFLFCCGLRAGDGLTVRTPPGPEGSVSLHLFLEKPKVEEETGEAHVPAV